MSTPVRMPKLGWTMEEGTVLQWYKKEGESITEGQPLLEVETDKVNIDVEAPATGILRSIQVGPDQTVAVETVLAIIAAADERLEEFGEPGAGRGRRTGRRRPLRRPPSSTSRSADRSGSPRARSRYARKLEGFLPHRRPAVWPGNTASIWPKSKGVDVEVSLPCRMCKATLRRSRPDRLLQYPERGLPSRDCARPSAGACSRAFRQLRTSRQLSRWT